MLVHRLVQLLASELPHQLHEVIVFFLLHLHLLALKRDCLVLHANLLDQHV